MQQDGKKPVIFAEKIVGFFFFFFFLPNVAKWIVFVLCTATYIKMSLRVKKKKSIPRNKYVFPNDGTCAMLYG